MLYLVLVDELGFVFFQVLVEVLVQLVLWLLSYVSATRWRSLGGILGASI